MDSNYLLESVEADQDERVLKLCQRRLRRVHIMNEKPDLIKLVTFGISLQKVNLSNERGCL